MAAAGSSANVSSPTANRLMLLTNLFAQIAFGPIAVTICLPSIQEWSVQCGGRAVERASVTALSGELR